MEIRKRRKRIQFSRSMINHCQLHFCFEKKKKQQFGKWLRYDAQIGRAWALTCFCYLGCVKSSMFITGREIINKGGNVSKKQWIRSGLELRYGESWLDVRLVLYSPTSTSSSSRYVKKGWGKRGGRHVRQRRNWTPRRFGSFFIVDLLLLEPLVPRG